MYYGSIKEGLLSVESQFKRQIVKSSGLSSQKSGKTKQKVIAKKKSTRKIKTEATTK